MNLSGSLLIWTLGQMPAEFYQKLDNTYIGNVGWEGLDTWGQYYYVVFKEDISKLLLDIIEKHSMFQQSYWDDEAQLIVVFKFDEDTYRTIVKPFTEGRYSEIDRTYANKYFGPTTASGKPSTNWQILNRAESLRKYWEAELNVTPYIRITIPEDAEVWSKIKKENEVLGYKAYLQSSEEVLESM